MNETDPTNVPAPAPEPAPPAPPPVAAEAPAGDAGVPPQSEGSGGEPGDTPEGGAGEGGRRRRRRRRRGRRDRDGAEGADGAEGGAPTEGSPEGAPAGDGPVPQEPRRPQHQQQPRHPRHGQPRHDQRHDPRHRRHDRKGSEHLALVATKALAEMAQALLKIEGVDPLAMPRFLDLNLRVPLDANLDARRAASTAVEQILQRVREVREHEKALIPGAVFSYFAGTADAEGCRPAEPRQVFDGYSSTGKPVFSDFVTLAIERKDPGIDQLLAGDDIVLTRVTMGRVLRTQQLAEFGNNSPVFKILGQVDAGLFRVLGAEGKCAFSFQLLRGTTLEGKPRLRLHPVGAVDVMDLADPSLLNLLSRCQRHLDTEALRLAGLLQNGEVDEEEFARPLLVELAQRLASRARHAGRRTQHANERADEGQRPTPRAYPDAGEAHDDAIWWDTEKSTIVVLGPKGRVHVFTPQARHVTSVMMQGSAVQNRRQQGRWRQAEPDERGEFRIHLKRLVAAGEDKPVEDVPPSATPPVVPSPAQPPVG
ncbi:MAG: hypothetical protein IPK26_10895 [Planctomycetes bacterium]|nr:hypothetical protein [Planctomycetota bacterium]